MRFITEGKLMKRISFLVLSVILSVVTLFFVDIAKAEDVDVNNYSYGTVKNISQDQITVTEYDYDTDEEIDETYAINSKTAFQNVTAIGEIAVGDNVDIVYVTENGVKIAQSIAAEKPSPEDESAPEGQQQEPSDKSNPGISDQEPGPSLIPGNQT